jgi:hypothetical protein
VPIADGEVAHAERLDARSFERLAAVEHNPAAGELAEVERLILAMACLYDDGPYRRALVGPEGCVIQRDELVIAE